MPPLPEALTDNTPTVKFSSLADAVFEQTTVPTLNKELKTKTRIGISDQDWHPRPGLASPTRIPPLCLCELVPPTPSVPGIVRLFLQFDKTAKAVDLFVDDWLSAKENSYIQNVSSSTLVDVSLCSSTPDPYWNELFEWLSPDRGAPLIESLNKQHVLNSSGNFPNPFRLSSFNYAMREANPIENVQWFIDYRDEIDWEHEGYAEQEIEKYVEDLMSKENLALQE